MIRASFSLLCASALLFSLACSREGPNGDVQDVNAAYRALVSEIAECGQEVADCVREASGDVEAIQICRDQLSDCGAAAADAVSALADAARDCAADAGACFQDAAGDRSGVTVCREQLAACLGIEMSVPGLSDGAGSAPVGDCIGTLLECIEVGDDVSACAGDVRSCVLDALPTPDQIGPPDLGELPGGAADAPIPDDLPGAGISEPRESALPTAADAAPVIDCVNALLECVQTGDDIPGCAANVQACVLDSAPVPQDIPDDMPTLPDAADVAPVSDCINTLFECIQAGENIAGCASNIQTCVLGTVPAPIDVEAAPDSSSLPGVPSGTPIPDAIPAPDLSGLPADVPSVALSCLDQFSACVADGGFPPVCVAEMRECAAGLAPQG